MTQIVNAPFKVTDIKLDEDGEKNYVEWKYLVEVSLGGMGNDGHLIETCPTDLEEAATCNTQEKCILAL